MGRRTVYKLNNTRYTLLEQVAAGGEGKLFRAKTPDDRIVALKELHEVPTAIDEKLGLWRSISSTGIVPALVDAGITDSGIERYLVVSDWIDARNIEQDLQQNRPTTSQVRDFAIQGLEALKGLHERGITHGDISPSNIMLTDGGVMYTDLGQLQDMTPDEHGLGSSVKTSNKMTFGYMAPEFIQGNADGTRRVGADIYAFGGVLVYRLTGKHPNDLLEEMDYTALDERTNDRSLSSVIKKMRARDPEQRYQTVDEVLTDLDTRAIAVREETGLEQRGLRQYLSRTAFPLSKAAYSATLVTTGLVYGSALALGALTPGQPLYYSALVTALVLTLVEAGGMLIEGSIFLSNSRDYFNEGKKAKQIGQK